MAENQKKYKLSSVLKSVNKDKRTGTLFCVNEENLQGRIYFREGRPTLARCRNLQGKQAIELIRKHLLITLKFHTNQNLVTLDEDEQEIINIPQQDEPDDTPDLDAINNTTAGVSPLTQLQNGSKLQAPMSTQAKEIIIEELKEKIVGPLAGVLVDGLEENIKVIDALNILAQEIGDTDIAMEFVEKVKARI